MRHSSGSNAMQCNVLVSIPAAVDMVHKQIKQVREWHRKPTASSATDKFRQTNLIINHQCQSPAKHSIPQSPHSGAVPPHPPCPSLLQLKRPL